jgi:hypothetical protein
MEDNRIYLCKEENFYGTRLTVSVDISQFLFGKNYTLYISGKDNYDYAFVDINEGVRVNYPNFRLEDNVS